MQHCKLKLDCVLDIYCLQLKGKETANSRGYKGTNDKAALGLVVFFSTGTSREISELSSQQRASWGRVGWLWE